MENLLRLDFPDSPDASLSVRKFTVEEAVSELFSVRLVAVSPVVGLELGRLVGGVAVFTLLGLSPRVWRGRCTAAEFARTSMSAGGLSTYEIEILPYAWRMSQRLQSRLFQHASIPDYVDQLLGEWRIEHRWDLDHLRYPKLELRTQFAETDFAFMSRLLEEAGISYFFEARGPDEPILVFSDAPERRTERVPAIVSVEDAGNAKDAEVEYLTKIQLRERSVPSRVTLRDHDFRRPREPLYVHQQGARNEELAHEQYHFAPGSFLSEDSPETSFDLVPTPVADDLGHARFREKQGQTNARLMLEAIESTRRELSYETSVDSLSPATVFRVLDHPREDVHGLSFLTLRMRIEGDVATATAWKMSGVAVSTDRPYRPARSTPTPNIMGILSAVVVGPRGVQGAPIPLPGGVGSTSSTPLDTTATSQSLVDNEIYVDEMGRVRVQFPWDRDHDLGAQSSIWMRVSQGWAGSGYGMFTVPRVGHEVLVGFVNGDPDNPLIIGRVHNANEPMPFSLPENKTVSTWKTASSPGGGGFNELRFDDAAGREHVYVQAQKDMDHLVKANLKQGVGGTASRYAQVADNIAVGGSRTKFVNVNELEATGMNHASFVGLNRSSSVGVEDSTLVGTRWSVTVARGMTRRLSRDLNSIASGLGDVMRSAATGVFGAIPHNPLAKAGESALARFGASAFGQLQKVLTVFEGFETDGGPPPTSIEIVDRQIKLSTGEASIVLDGPNVVITAQGNISLHAVSGVTVLSDGEIAIAGRQKVALVSATDDVIVQAKKDLHLNPYESDGRLKQGVRIAGTSAQREGEQTPPCATCGGPTHREGEEIVCRKVSNVLDKDGTPTRVRS